MSDARWFEVKSDIEAAIRHFGRSVELYRRGGFDAPGLDGYQAGMALMHSLQSAHTSLEGGLIRILAILDEERPVGENWHADLIKRVAAALPGKRPPVLEGDLVSAAEETRRLRRQAFQNYHSFEVREATRTIRAAELLAAKLGSAVDRFRKIIDPPAA